MHDSFQRAKIYVITGQMYRPKINPIISKFYIIMNSTKKKMKDFLRILYELKFYDYLRFALHINAHTGSQVHFLVIMCPLSEHIRNNV